MKTSTLRAALNARPFRPFEVRFRDDGEKIVVQHPEQVFLAEKKSTVIIDVSDRIHILETAQISKLARLHRRFTNSTKR